MIDTATSKPYLTGSIGVLLIAGCLAALSGCADNPAFPEMEVPAPYVIITQPEMTAPEMTHSAVTRFSWTHPDTFIVSHTRYLLSMVVDTTGSYNPGFDIIKDLNENPWRYENKWSSWTELDGEDPATTATTIGDDEDLQTGRYYILAVQARDRRGRMTAQFVKNINIRRFLISTYLYPHLHIYEKLLHVSSFLSTNKPPVREKLPAGIPLHFKWRASAAQYGGSIVGFRYGWDVADLQKWNEPYRADLTSIPEIAFYSGLHTLTVEVIDLAGSITRGEIEIEIVPFPMDRNLLLVDDFYSTNFPQTSWSMPTENQHDEFWLGLCARSMGFDPGRDIFDTSTYAFYPPPLEILSRYKNIVWTYSSSDRSAWKSVVYFTPESEIGKINHSTTSYLSVYLRKGGHLLTAGRADNSGGLASVLKSDAQSFPLRLHCEIAGNRDNCSGDRSGVHSFAYHDYCVSVLDKIDGILRKDSHMPYRSLSHFDVMKYAVKDSFDIYTTSEPGLPERLVLWEEITKPGRYFDPDSLSEPGGFTYVEVYNPQYWMDQKFVYPQECFHPMYRMRSKSEDSALDYGTVALWVTKYSDVVPDVSAGTAVAAPSFHFGLPLWFFERTAVDSIMDVVFKTWNIDE